MMMHKIIKKDEPGIFLVPIVQLSHVEKWVEHIQNDCPNLQLTLLFKLGRQHMGADDLKLLRPGLKAYWEGLLGPDLEFGFFFNEDIGTLFVAGPFKGIFLQKINNKKLGTYTNGVRGILEGLGLNDRKTAKAMQKLGQGQYLFIGKITAERGKPYSWI